MFVVGSGFVGAVECNADLSQGGNSCTVSSSLTLNGSYVINMNGSSSGAITISGSNLLFDCNNTKLIGNKSTTNRGIYMNAKTNITIKNCILSDFYRDNIAVDNGNVNISILNNTLLGDGTLGIYIKASNNTEVYNNFINLTSNSIYNALTLNSYNANIYNNTLVRGGIVFYNAYNYNVYRNFFRNITDGSVIFTDFSYNTSIYNNNIFNHTLFGMIKIQRSNNSNVYNNILDKGDLGIWVVTNNTNIVLNNNTITNIDTNVDSWSAGIGVEGNNTNITIINNNITNYGSLGILVRMTNTYNISGNYFQKEAGINSLYEPNSAIAILELYKTYLGDGTESITNNRANKIGTYVSSNGHIQGNTFGNLVDVLLRNQGDVNLVHDLSNYWFRSFQYSYLTDRDDFYISNNYNNISNTNSSLNYNNIMKQGLMLNYYLSYSMFRDYSYFKNLNGSYSNQTNIYSLTTSLIYNTSNYATQGSGNINITLQPNEYIYVLDNYNITEGYTRSYDPIYNGTYLNSTLTNQVTVGSSVTHYSNGYFTSGASISSSALTINPGNKAETLS